MTHAPKANPYIYSASIVRVVDGDTVDAMVDLGFRSSVRLRFRLFGINAPEVRGPERAEGIQSTHWLKRRIEFQDVIINTHQDSTGKFGRYLATIWRDNVNINEQMVELGLAKPASY